MSRSEYEEDLQAELGYRTAGRREISQREWFSLRGEPGEAAPNHKTFAKLVNVLRVKKWAKEHPERRRVIANRYARKPDVSARSVRIERERRRAQYRAAGGAVIACHECGAEFCPINPPRGVPRMFCSERCGYLNLGRRNRRATGRRETTCQVCGESGHNSRRHA